MKIKRTERKKENNIALWIALISCIATAFASISSFISASQTKLANKVNLRPYIMIKNTQNVLLFNGPPFVVLPYQLENVGAAPALNIRKGYTSYIIEKSSNERLIQDFRELQEKKDALLPSQTSAIHPDNINITGFDSSKLDSIKCIRVELKTTYQGFPEVDQRTYYSKSILELYPGITPDGKVIFMVSQPKLDFGFENQNK